MHCAHRTGRKPWRALRGYRTARYELRWRQAGTSKGLVMRVGDEVEGKGFFFFRSSSPFIIRSPPSSFFFIIRSPSSFFVLLRSPSISFVLCLSPPSFFLLLRSPSFSFSTGYPLPRFTMVVDMIAMGSNTNIGLYIHTSFLLFPLSFSGSWWMI